MQLVDCLSELIIFESHSSSYNGGSASLCSSFLLRGFSSVSVRADLSQSDRSPKRIRAHACLCLRICPYLWFSACNRTYCVCGCFCEVVLSAVRIYWSQRAYSTTSTSCKSHTSFQVIVLPMKVLAKVVSSVAHCYDSDKWWLISSCHLFFTWWHCRKW